MKYLTNIGHVALRELDIIVHKNRIYGFCMVVFPVLLVVFFTTMLDEGLPQDLPVGVVDQDNRRLLPRASRRSRSRRPCSPSPSTRT